MRIPFVKSREQREFERRLSYRRIVRGLEGHVARLQQAQGRFRDLLRDALALADEEAIQRNARACAALRKRMERVQSQILAVEGAEAVCEMTRCNRDFAEFLREAGRSMVVDTVMTEVATFQADLERGILQAEELDAMLADVMGTVSENLVGFGARADDSDVEAVIREALDDAHRDRDDDLEAQVARELAAVKETVGKG